MIYRVGGLLLALMASWGHGWICDYEVLEHPVTKHKVHLIPDLHEDMDDMAVTMDHQDQLLRLIQRYKGYRREVIVEDRVSLFSRGLQQTGEWIGEIHSATALRSIATMHWCELSYQWLDIPVYNAEFRWFSPEQTSQVSITKRVLEAVEKHGDPGLKPLYDSIRPYMERLEEDVCIKASSFVLDALIMTRIMHNEQRHVEQQFVVAGRREHISRMNELLKCIGYTSKYSALGPWYYHKTLQRRSRLQSDLEEVPTADVGKRERLQKKYMEDVGSAVHVGAYTSYAGMISVEQRELNKKSAQCSAVTKKEWSIDTLLLVQEELAASAQDYQSVQDRVVAWVREKEAADRPKGSVQG